MVKTKKKGIYLHNTQLGCAALCHRRTQMQKVCMGSKPTTQTESGKKKKKLGKNASRTRIQRPHQFVVTGSEQGLEP